MQLDSLVNAELRFLTRGYRYRINGITPCFLKYTLAEAGVACSAGCTRALENRIDNLNRAESDAAIRLITLRHFHRLHSPELFGEVA